ncbi:unnamed protein product [Adineta ricciae]|uniref:Uncharacterized protein n=1 Tax=Adineta ricciae TaxID=249248 RepID=A0A815R3K5_ADIRI|nr:unnamed protein product [Adineta ricciae]
MGSNPLEVFHTSSRIIYHQKMRPKPVNHLERFPHFEINPEEYQKMKNYHVESHQPFSVLLFALYVNLYLNHINS